MAYTLFIFVTKCTNYIKYSTFESQNLLNL